MTPPFQSPDEFEHITRAYLLTRGDVVLSAPEGQSSGGYVDSGLAQYMNSYSHLPFRPENKLDTGYVEETQKIKWAGTYEFRPALGMAYYFPGIYGVHALGLKSGEVLGLSVADSYQLTRLLLLLAISVILFCAFQMVAPSYIVVALLFIPMSLFQFASASLDGLATAIAIWIVALFVKSYRDSTSVGNYAIYMAVFAWTLLASSRLQMLPLAALLFVLGWTQRKYRLLCAIGVALLFVIGWQILMLKTVVDGRVPLGGTSSEILLFYIKHPLELINVFLRTLSEGEIARGYFSSFFGLLGWLDTPFPGAEYKYLFFATLAFLLISIDYVRLNEFVFARATLGLCAAGALFIVFLAMLVTWTPHPASVIEGVQGRYFLVPALLIAYALSGVGGSNSLRLRDYICWIAVWIFGLLSTVITFSLLVDRYYSLS